MDDNGRRNVHTKNMFLFDPDAPIRIRVKNLMSRKKILVWHSHSLLLPYITLDVLLSAQPSQLVYNFSAL